jgi:hypothetical protein
MLSSESSDGGSAAAAAGGSAAAGAARVCSACGVADIVCESVVVWVPAAVPVAWATEADCEAAPAGLVVFGGGSNGVNCEAIAQEAA